MLKRFLISFVVLTLLLTLSTTVMGQVEVDDLPPQIAIMLEAPRADGDYSDMIHPDFVWFSNGVPYGQGIELFPYLMNFYYGLFPDLTAEVTYFIEDEDMIAYHAVMKGTHTGEMADIPPTGNELLIEYNSMILLDNGLIREIYMGFDGIEWDETLGILNTEFVPEPMMVDDLLSLPLDMMPDALQFFFSDTVTESDAITEWVSPDFVWYSNGHVHGEGIEGFTMLMQGYMALYPDLNNRVLLLCDGGEYISTRVMGIGTHTGSLPGVEATNNKLTMDYLAFFHLDEEGRIDELWMGFDNYVWNGTLGLPIMNLYALES